MKKRVLILCTGNSAEVRWRKHSFGMTPAIVSRSRVPVRNRAQFVPRLSLSCGSWA